MKNPIMIIKEYDIAISNWIGRNQNSNMKLFYEIITCLGAGLFMSFVYVLLFLAGDEKTAKTVSAAITGELAGLTFIILLRNIFPRERPSKNVNSLNPLPWNKYSFPSHHALRVSMLATLFGRVYPSILIILIIVAILISFSRVYLNKHFVTDVLAGGFIGFICGQITLIIFAGLIPDSIGFC